MRGILPVTQSCHHL
jgi:hypothetical protein